MAITPDIQGFREAQQRKRDLLGEDLIFRSEITLIYPPDTPLAIDGTALDPTAEPLSSGQASAVIRCGVAFRSGTQESAPVAAGEVERTHLLAIAPSGAAETIQQMSSFERAGDTYLIRAQKFDGVSGIDRYLVWGERDA